MNQEEIENMNTPITSREIKSIKKKKKPSNKQKLRAKWLHRQILPKKFGEELTSILLKLFQKIAEEEKLPKSFYEATITLNQKPDKVATQQKDKIIDQYL